MSQRKLLLPINVNKCRPAVFEIVNRFGRDSQPTAILLHVVTLNLMTSENRVYEELIARADSHLRRLARKYLNPNVSVISRVRVGKVGQEILAQAVSDRPDLILMAVDGAIPGKRLFRTLSGSTANLSRTVGGIIQKLPCDVLVIPAGDCFDCEKAWGHVAGVSSTASAGVTR